MSLHMYLIVLLVQALYCWLNALVTPVPKVPAPVCLSDFRPISVTPHLSRIAEKVIVHHWLYPAIPADNLIDQYAFKPTGSTTAAWYTSPIK